ncbi:MAG TPA: sigma 54-interacting transcriptional regulator [Syntrophorhabdaceae bacterium]|nr:sigma 54-interacting transcriptional regulator [Syntrophorhabdaceae bacterium]
MTKDRGTVLLAVKEMITPKRLSVFLTFLLYLVPLLFLMPETAHAVSALDGFNPNVNGPVYSIAALKDKARFLRFVRFSCLLNYRIDGSVDMTEKSHSKWRQKPTALGREVDQVSVDRNRTNSDGIWKTMVNNAVIGVYRTTKQGAFLYVNQKFSEIFGFDSPDSFLKAIPDISRLYAHESRGQAILDELENKGFVDRLEIQANRKDQKTIWISFSGRRTREASGQVFWEGFITDITDRKRAEQSMQESENRFRMLVEQAGDAFFIHDYAGNIIDINKQACKTLGYTHEELLRMNIADIDIEIKNKRHIPRFWERLNSGQHITFEGLQKKKSGLLFPVEVRLGRLDLGDRKLLLSLTRDITERKGAEEKLKKAFQEIIELKNCLEEENIHLRQEIELTYRHDKIVGESPAIRKILQKAEKVAKGETYVLIQGETGTGKELLARAIHNMSSRKGRPMVTVNCAALPPTLIESELFGREKGAYTGAISKQPGRFEMANGSTLFLDEIADLPLELQVKLLRVLENGQFERLGSPETISVDVRIIAATNQDLTELVKEKKFRNDLYYRLNVFPISIPALRERLEDIPLLVWAFVREFNQSMGKSIVDIPKRTMDRLQSYSWPGNIRELRNVIERAMILSSDSTLHIDNFDGVNMAARGIALAVMEKDHILRMLEKTGWRISGKSGAATLLGLKESTLRSRMKKLGINRPKPI